MSNMSYCRFRNTLKDLGDCIDALENDEHPDVEKSPEEHRAMLIMGKRCQDYLENLRDKCLIDD